MKELITYALEVILSSGILLGAYILLLERRVKFHYCRFFLLTAMAAAIIIPLLNIPIWPAEVISLAPAVTTDLGPMQEWTPSQIDIQTTPTITTAMWLGAAYALGAGIILSMMFWQAVRIVRLRQRGKIITTDRFTLIQTPHKIASFSFFKTIYVWEQTPEEDLQAIIAHESSHICHRHSIERLVMECLKAAMWWNPFVWIAARRLTEAEEFEADSDVLAAGYDISEYINTIFKQLFGYSPEIANGLRDSLTKKRFKMMTMQTPGRHSLLRLAGTIPVIIGLLCAFSFTSRAAIVVTQDDAQPTEHQPAPQAKQGKSQVTLLVRISEQNSEGGRTIKPAKGAAAQVVGSTIATVADEEGKIEMVVPQGSVIEVSYPGYQKQVVTTEGAEVITIGFILVSEANAPTAPATLYTRDEDGVAQRPLYIIDQVEEPSMSIDANKIEQIKTLKPEEAIAKYGERGRYGAIEVTTNSPRNTSKAKPANDGAENSKVEDEPFVVTPTMPSFEGGDLLSFRNWVQSQIKFPELALLNKLQGRVICTFVIERDGKLSSVEILQSPDKMFSDEARRVLNSSSAWSPGLAANGTPVRIKYTLPVDFRIQNDAAQQALTATEGLLPTLQDNSLNLRSWIQSKLRYPAEALKAKTSGQVVVTYTVEKDGRIGSCDVLSTPDRALSEEVLRVLAQAPRANAAILNGEAAATKYTLRVDYRLQPGLALAGSSPKPTTQADIIVVGYLDEPSPVQKK